MPSIENLDDALEFLEGYSDYVDSDIKDAVYLVRKDIEMKDEALMRAIENKFEPDKWLWYAKQAL